METITIKLNDYQVSLLRAKIKDLSVQSYMENLLFSALGIQKDAANERIRNYEVSPFVRSLSKKGAEEVPAGANGTDALIEQKYL